MLNMVCAYHMKKIKLTNGGYAVVDDSDYEELSANRWRRADIDGISYAVRTGTKKDGNQNAKIIFMHRYLMNNPSPEVDHIDGNGLNNQRSNLRVATRAQNMQNRCKYKRKCSSKYKGVSWRPGANGWRGHWRVAIAGKEIGWFYGRASEKDAALAYDKAAKVKFGEFARLNFPMEK